MSIGENAVAVAWGGRRMTDLPAGVRTLFEGQNNGHVATVLPDGAPHTVPVWVGVEDGQVVFLTGPQSRKARNLARDPRVAISVTDRENPFWMAQVRGRARRLDGAAAWAIIDRMSHKYVGAPYPRTEERVIFVVEAEHVVEQNFG
jgi:PPOX class probable F420-dependent enzyme